MSDGLLWQLQLQMKCLYVSDVSVIKNKGLKVNSLSHS